MLHIVVGGAVEVDCFIMSVPEPSEIVIIVEFLSPPSCLLSSGFLVSFVFIGCFIM